MISPRGILKKHAIRPSKRLGQSFLIDNNITAKIVESSEITSDDIVVEIGAGLGVMTAMIARHARKVVALEIDPRLIDVLREELKDISNVEILKQDVLTYDISSALGEPGHAGDDPKKVKVIGNVPYNISSQILLRILAYREFVSSITLMFQKEVADRLLASPGTKAYGLLSVLTVMYAMPERVTTVPASCFYPKPRVDSAVLKMVVRQKPLIELKDADLFFTVVKTAFSKRRKTLINNLKSSEFIKSYGTDINALLETVGIDGRRRGEALTAVEFGKLSNAIFSIQKA